MELTFSFLYPTWQHYDVQPALKSDGWKDEPFQLIVDEKTGTLTGRGSTDDKGPILGWINAVEAHKQAGWVEEEESRGGRKKWDLASSEMGF